MPLYNEKDSLLDMLLDEERLDLHLVNEEITKADIKIEQIKKHLSSLELKRLHIKKKIKTLKDMFENYNKPL